MKRIKTLVGGAIVTSGAFALLADLAQWHAA
jgi:hypothetical protein